MTEKPQALPYDSKIFVYLFQSRPYTDMAQIYVKSFFVKFKQKFYLKICLFFGFLHLAIT